MTENIIIRFEQTRKLDPYEACRVLGIPYSTYMRNRRQANLPKDTRYHVEALGLLTDEQFSTLRAERMSTDD